ncbi:MAG: Na(+)/H(+) antiporter subunit B, partial [Pseudomonadales bacterium]
GVYGLLSASFFVAMDAVDVAFTEAAVGAGISTLLILVVLSMTGRQQKATRHRPLAALLVAVGSALLLFYGISDMPLFGDPQAPIHNHVAPRYIWDSPSEVGIPNIVTSVLASYRAFDTFGEVVVIFTAGMGVLALLSSTTPSTRPEPTLHSEHSVIRIVSKILFPFIFLFGLYVQFHGDFGPGGGFQAGVIFAAAIILYSMLFGLEVATKVFKPDAIRLIAALGVLIYASVGVANILSGANFFDYSTLAADPVAGQHVGILLIELGVGCTVAAVMVMIFFSFSARREQQLADTDTEDTSL